MPQSKSKEGKDGQGLDESNDRDKENKGQVNGNGENGKLGLFYFQIIINCVIIILGNDVDPNDSSLNTSDEKTSPNRRRVSTVTIVYFYDYEYCLIFYLSLL